MHRLNLAVLSFVCLAGAAAAQAGAAVPPGLAMMQSGFPNVSSISEENAAGLLSYCVKNHLIPAGSTQTVTGALMKKPNIAMSSGYALGEKGQIISAHRGPMTFADIPPDLKGQACEAVLKRGNVLLAQHRP